MIDLLQRQDIQRLCQFVRESVPQERPNPVEFGEQYCRLPGSAKSERFICSITPWIRDPLMDLVNNIVRSITFVKPVQSGGSVFGEIAIMYFIVWMHGIIQYNWSNDKRAEERWASRFDAVLRACSIILERLGTLPRDKVSQCEIDFGNAFFRMQGALVSENLDSDSVRYQVNEEVHAWKAGHLDKAYRRTTAIWNHKILNISNASKKDDQLHKALKQGTHQLWEVKCPGCSNPHHEANAVYHTMRTRWLDRHPEFGGLRYDTTDCRYGRGDFNYNKLEKTLRYQMPCGYVVHNTVRERRALSLSGRYSKPTNEGAHESKKSYTLDAVAVDFINWLDLVMEKHEALRQRQQGDLAPYQKYVTERECGFFDPEEIPGAGRVAVSVNLRKSRKGLADKRWRFFALDKQRGADGDFPHWWLVIRDFNANGDSLLVFEGRLDSDANVVQTLKDHDCIHHLGVADSGDDTMRVYLFCYDNGINAIKGGTNNLYSGHPGGALRIYKPEVLLHGMCHKGPKYPMKRGFDGLSIIDIPDPREPRFWIYSKFGIRERLDWFRLNTNFQCPADVSDDYREHMDSEEKVTRQHPRTNEKIIEYINLGKANHLYVCEAYIAMQAEMAGVVAGIPLKINPETAPPAPKTR